MKKLGSNKKIYFLYFFLTLFFYLCSQNVKRHPLENLYEEGITEELVTLSLSENQGYVEIWDVSNPKEVDIQYSVKRSFENFKNRLKIIGQVECHLCCKFIVRTGTTPFVDYPINPVRIVDMDSLAEKTGILSSNLYHSTNLSMPVEGQVIFWMNAQFMDKDSLRHWGNISNNLQVPAIFH